MKQDDPIIIKNPGRMLTVTYVVSLSVIAALSIIVHFMLDEVIAEQNSTGKIVNVSGQQRMLSQRASMFTIDFMQSGSDSSRRLALAAVNKMKSNQAFLLEDHYQAIEQGKESPLSSTLVSMYFSPPSNVVRKLQVFESEIKAALSEQTNENIDLSRDDLLFLKLSETELLNPLHEIVGQYEAESLQKVNDLRKAQNVVLGIIILTILVEAFFIFRPMVDKVTRFANKLQKDANFDFLSGLLNRRAFQIVAEQAVAASSRYKRPLSLVMLDIDFFKRINDTYGHEVGDKAIKHVATLLQQKSRGSDHVARVGGEEFVLLLPDTDKKGAFFVADKLREVLENTQLVLDDKEINITLSGGVSSVSDSDHSVDSLLRAADDALYKAKQGGRNQIQMA